jgi:hypothetical protein
VARAIWHAIEGTTKTEQSNRFVAVHDGLREILLGLWKTQGSPISGYILSRDGERVNLDNMSKRTIRPAFSLCAICKQEPDAKHKGHAYKRDASLPEWHGWYSLRRFHATQVRHKSGSGETVAKSLGNSKDVAEKHYVKSTAVLPEVKKAVRAAFSGLS